LAYHQFTLLQVTRRFQLVIQERPRLFAHYAPIEASEWLRTALDRMMPLALDFGTEKARSEFIIAPLLGEARELLDRAVSIYSGAELNVDPSAGLQGSCDYLIGLSRLRLEVEAPLIAVVVAKNENFQEGFAQCLAELVAVQRFNAADGRTVPRLYGAVTTGNNWRFLQLEGNSATIDETDYHINQVERILGVLVGVLREGLAGPAGAPADAP
jgi:hypothetical protein